MPSLTAAQRNRAGTTRVWIVWYEDRFGWGSNREPAAAVAAFLDPEDAQRYVADHGGEHDVAAGKFDGLFVQEWTLLDAVERGLVTPDRAGEILDASGPDGSPQA